MNTSKELAEKIWPHLRHLASFETFKLAQDFIESIQADARKQGMHDAAETHVGFELPTGYTGKNQVHGIHYSSGHAHGVADLREAIRKAATP